MAKIRVLLVEDHELVRGLLAERLSQEESLEVVGTTASGAQATDMVASLKPDLVLMDIVLPGGTSCFEIARRIKAHDPATHILFLSAYHTDHYIDESIRVGASGYLTKDESTETIIQRIQDVVSGERDVVYSAPILERIAQKKGKDDEHDRTRASTLTDREREVLVLIASGLAKKQIAVLLNVGVKTVEKHTENLMAKLDIHDRVELTRYAIREGILQP